MDEKTLLNLIIGISGAVTLLAILVIVRTKRRVWRFVFVPVALIGLVISAGLYAYTHRPQPIPEQRTLFRGVEYQRLVRTDPVPLVIHIVRIQLDQVAIEFLVTPRTPIDEYEQTARTTSQFLSEFDAQIAINGDFFDPWFEYGPFNYYPHVGDGVNLRGVSILDGERQSEGYSQNYQTLSILTDHLIVIGESVADAQLAISGYLTPVREGQGFLDQPMTDYMAQRHPRTALAVDQANTTLMLFVIDGRQPNYSEGATIPELAQIIIAAGGYNALNLDGGGSTTLVMQAPDGNAVVLNSPIHGRIPGLERPIGNHFGIRALALENATE